MKRARDLLTAVIVVACLPCVAQASESVSLHATLTPERLGHGTTVGFSFHIAASGGQVPSPLTAVDLRYPGNLGIALSGLGLATCTASTLEVFGADGCPADARMGYGSAVAEIAFGPEIVAENAQLSIVRAPTKEGHIALLLWVSGPTPVDAQVTFPALLLTASGLFGGRLDVNVPLVEGLPGGADVSVVELHSTIGPEHLTYYERVHGKEVAYNPAGILLPERCPRGGFPFAASFAFMDGTQAAARTEVPCPRARSRRKA